MIISVLLGLLLSLKHLILVDNHLDEVFLFLFYFILNTVPGGFGAAVWRVRCWPWRPQHFVLLLLSSSTLSCFLYWHHLIFCMTGSINVERELHPK